MTSRLVSLSTYVGKRDLDMILQEPGLHLHGVYYVSHTGIYWDLVYRLGFFLFSSPIQEEFLYTSLDFSFSGLFH